jgi:hypothetical protein
MGSEVNSSIVHEPEVSCLNGTVDIRTFLAYEKELRGEIAAAKERHAGVFLQKVDGSGVD